MRDVDHVHDEQGDGPAMSPCAACRERATCRQACAALVAMLPPESRTPYREVSSDALLQGRLRAASVGPQVLELEDAEADEPPAMASPLLPRLRSALAQLPSVERTLVLDLQSGASAARLARRYRTHPCVVAATAKHTLQWLGKEVTAVADIDTKQPIEPAAEDDMTKHSNQIVRLETDRIRCAEPTCQNAVSSRPPARAELAVYCGLHRRRLARDNEGLAALGAYLPTDPLLPPTSAERATAHRLLSSKTPGQEIVLITPGIAIILLKHNDKNRTLNTARVDVLARDILAGAWQLNYQGIALCNDATVADGQHRLSAVVRARRAVLMCVAFGLPPSVRYTLDQGRSRSLADTLRIVDGNTDGTRIVSWFRAIDHLVSGRPKPMSQPILHRQLERYGASVRWLIEHGPRARPFYRTPLVSALLYAHRVLPDEVSQLTTRYVSGSDLPAGSPVLTLRDYAISVADPPRIIGLKTLRCLLAEIRGEQIDRLHASEEGLQYFRNLHQADARDRTDLLAGPQSPSSPPQLRQIG